MISSHNRVLSILLGVLFAASSTAIASSNGPAETAPNSPDPVSTPATESAAIPASGVNTLALSAANSGASTTPVVITTERLFIRAHPDPTSASVVITTEPLVVQAVAQK